MHDQSTPPLPFTIGNPAFTGSTNSKSTKYRDLVDLLALSHVPRWAIVPMLRPQSVAEHSYRVTVILAWLTNQIHTTHPLPDGGPDYMGPRSWSYAMAHDVEECRTGDIPGPAKRRLGASVAEQKASARIDYLGWTPAQRDLWNLDQDFGPHFMLRLKLADLIEAYTYLHAWGRHCDHRTRVLTELGNDIRAICDQLEALPYPKPAIGWWPLVTEVIGAIVYEAR